jgi:hypothetical protein
MDVIGINVELFTKDECWSIVQDFEKNKAHIKLSKDHGIERISSYEIDVQHFSEKIKDLIYSKVEYILGITGGKVGMVFGVKYSMDTKNYMSAHYDCNSFSCVIPLNSEFKGGGTYFPLTGEVVKSEVGDGFLFVADNVDSYHEAYPITEGVRYVLVIRIENKGIFRQIYKALFLHVVDKIIQKFKNRLYKKPLI